MTQAVSFPDGSRTAQSRSGGAVAFRNVLSTKRDGSRPRKMTQPPDAANSRKRSSAYLSTFTKRGYAVAEFYFQEVAIDNKERARTDGVYQLFGEEIDCGALMAWAWGSIALLTPWRPCADPQPQRQCHPAPR